MEEAVGYHLVTRAQRGDERRSRVLPLRSGIGLTLSRTGSCVTSTSPRTRRSRRCWPSGVTFRSSATPAVSRPGHTDSLPAPATPRVARSAAGHRTCASFPLTSRRVLTASPCRRPRPARARVPTPLSRSSRCGRHASLPCNWPLDRIAGSLGVPVGTVRSRLHYAMRALRAALDADARRPTREAAQ